MVKMFATCLAVIAPNELEGYVIQTFQDPICRDAGRIYAIRIPSN
jgi:hypothetical protein